MYKAIAAALSLSAIFAASPASAVVVGFSPSAQTAGPSDTISLDLTVSGLGDGAAPSVGGFDFDILYDPSALTFDGYALGTDLGDEGLFEQLDFSFGDLGGGLIDLASTSVLLDFDLDLLQGSSIVLATLDFTVDVLALGASTSVSVDTFDPFLLLSDGFGQDLAVTAFNGATIRNPNPNVVSAPSGIALFALGLLGLGLTRRQKA
ncbi:MAG: hypothetical protein AAGC95_16295 [Pseudomonadota bacterium]